MENWNDEIITNADLKFMWRDRLRILFGRVVLIEVRIKTENRIGYAQAGTMVRVEPIFGHRPADIAPGVVSSSQSQDVSRMDKIDGMDQRPQRSYRGLGPA